MNETKKGKKKNGGKKERKKEGSQKKKRRKKVREMDRISEIQVIILHKYQDIEK